MPLTELGGQAEARRVMRQVAEHISRRRLDLGPAAKAIGVTRASLDSHLSGDYVRSDSLAKYRAWLDDSCTEQPLLLPFESGRKPAVDAVDHQHEPPAYQVPQTPHRIVDLFAGAGGLSLGFELLDHGALFEVVLALELEEPMVTVYNRNRPHHGSAQVCRRADLSQFGSRAEVLAFYLDHLATVGRDTRLRADLDGLGLARMTSQIAGIDRLFVERARGTRESASYQRARRRLSSGTLGQTSVVGFHRALGLPLTSAKEVDLCPLPWRSEAPDVPAGIAPVVPSAADIDAGLSVWQAEVHALKERAGKTGRGQLASSAARITEFVDFLATAPMNEMKQAWLQWRAARDTVRRDFFGTDNVRRVLDELYTPDRHVAVLLGGPPCQGFSRIGRGKIRSLREHGVQVHEDDEAGDARNRLLEAYVLFVDALSPNVFVFENVRHFEAKVRTRDGVFHASEVLSAAIQDISDGDLEYRVASRIIDMSRHLVPQTRERYFMLGTRMDRNGAAPELSPDDCLRLTPREPLPLRVALTGLAEPETVGDVRLSSQTPVQLEAPRGNAAEALYLQWVRHSPEGHGDSTVRHTDAHVVRPPRRDDRDLFSLFGPGKRWMDYRCDDAPTLRVLRAAVEALGRAVRVASDDSEALALQAALDGIAANDVERILARIDGSLSLRLLMESIAPLRGETAHHLLAPGYLSKRDGNHGDWLARLDPNRPGKTIVSHMGKDTYAYVHPYAPRTLSVREAARVQTFPDRFSFGSLSLVDAFRAVGNAVPPLLASQIAVRVAAVLQPAHAAEQTAAV